MKASNLPHVWLAMGDSMTTDFSIFSSTYKNPPWMLIWNTSKKPFILSPLSHFLSLIPFHCSSFSSLFPCRFHLLKNESFKHHLEQNSSVRGSLGSIKTSGEGGAEQLSQASEKHQIWFLFLILLILLLLLWTCLWILVMLICLI